MEDLAACHPGVSRSAGIEPVELAARGGDVLFLDFLCGHIGSPNRSEVPRLMFQSRFGIPATLDGHRVGGNVW